MMSFFAVFKDPAVKKALSPVYHKVDEKNKLLRNYYLANPAQLKQLMSDYNNPEAAGEKKDAWLKKELLGGNMDKK